MSEVRWREDGVEPALDPGRPLVDPHHHLWPHRDAGTTPAGRYEAQEFRADLLSGHRVAATVAIECRVAYRPELGPQMAPVGETGFLAAQAVQLTAGPRLAGIVSHIDLRSPEVAVLIEAHKAAGQGLLRGVRQMAAWNPRAGYRISPIDGDLYAEAEFREGVRALGRAGLVFDAWHFHSQNAAFADLVAACPETTFVLDHAGTPLGIGGYAGRRAEVFTDWREGMKALAAMPNLFVKVSGFGMSMVAAPWRRQAEPPTSGQIAEDVRPWFDAMVEAFTPRRLMFASNFPVDKVAVSYGVLWNAFKRLAARLPETEVDALCRGTARGVYRLGDTR